MATIGLDKLCYAMFTEDDRHIQGRLWHHRRLAALIRDSTKPRLTPQIFWRIQAKQNLLARNCININTSRQLVEVGARAPVTKFQLKRHTTVPFSCLRTVARWLTRLSAATIALRGFNSPN